MKTNMGNIDRLIRILIAAVVVGLYYQGKISGIYATVGLIISVIFVITSFISFCPLYFSFRINTKKRA
ncbi:MAG TPA: DUF2892 domain-containing protein [Cyclobacteriaceae bacterium]|nr:DUF2892 domain-containing protein [Cyclobacteriaceae bacterium]